jgi:hypothetical protein
LKEFSHFLTESFISWNVQQHWSIDKFFGVNVRHRDGRCKLSYGLYDVRSNKPRLIFIKRKKKLFHRHHHAPNLKTDEKKLMPYLKVPLVGQSEAAAPFIPCATIAFVTATVAARHALSGCAYFGSLGSVTQIQCFYFLS